MNGEKFVMTYRLYEKFHYEMSTERQLENIFMISTELQNEMFRYDILTERNHENFR